MFAKHFAVRGGSESFIASGGNNSGEARKHCRALEFPPLASTTESPTPNHFRRNYLGSGTTALTGKSGPTSFNWSLGAAGGLEASTATN
jgi:hypothetical protein